VAFVLGVFSIRQSHEVSRDPFDVPGWLAIATAFASLVFAVDLGSSMGWTNPAELCLLVAFTVLLVVFVRREGRAGHPLISLAVFSHRRFVMGVVALVCLQFVVLGLSFLIPNYSQLVMGTGETEAGSILLPGCVVGACMAPLSGQILDRFGPRRPILVGASCALLGTALFAALSESLATAVAIAIYVCFAFGQSLMVGNTMTESLSFFASGHQGRWQCRDQYATAAGWCHWYRRGDSGGQYGAGRGHRHGLGDHGWHARGVSASGLRGCGAPGVDGVGHVAPDPGGLGPLASGDGGGRAAP
jgi:hypothetical protein